MRLDVACFGRQFLVVGFFCFQSCTGVRVTWRGGVPWVVACLNQQMGTGMQEHSEPEVAWVSVTLRGSSPKCQGGT